MDIQPVIDVMEHARDLIARPNGWTQGTMARDSEGRYIATRRPEAVCFCAFGAVMRSVDDKVKENHAVYSDAHFSIGIHALEDLVENKPIESWNDKEGRTQGEVVSLFDRAIANLKAKSS